MVSTRRKRQSNRRLLSQLGDSDQDMIIGNAASTREENIVVNEGTNDLDFTAVTSSNNTVINENVVNVKTLERCFNERIDREMSNIVDTVEDRIQNAILSAIENIVAPKIELAIRSINASSGRDVTSVTANSERGEHVGINAPIENASGNNNILHVSNVNDETRHNIPDGVSDLSIPQTHFDRQAHTHPICDFRCIGEQVYIELVPNFLVSLFLSRIFRSLSENNRFQYIHFSLETVATFYTHLLALSR